MKRFLCVMLTLLLTLSVLLPCAATEASAAGLTVDQLKTKFPHGAYWNHQAGSSHSYGNYGHCGGSCNNPDGYTWSPCIGHNVNAAYGQYDCNVFDGGLQCCGFARKLAYDAYGSYASKWPSSTGSAALNNLKPGDVLHYTGGGADAKYGHWVFVIGVSGNAITVGECNVDGHLCQIRWGRVIYKGNISNPTVYSAPYALGSSGNSGTVVLPDSPNCPITWTDSTVQPKDTDAYIYTKANAAYSGKFDACGIIILDANGKEVGRKAEAANASNYVEIWYNLTDELGITLKRGTTYYYQIQVRFNGTTYGTHLTAFTTTGGCTSHSFSWKVTQAATCQTSGAKEGVCANCGYTTVQTVPSTDHDYEITGVVSPTCTEKGYTNYTCTMCGKGYSGNFVDPACPSAHFSDAPETISWAHAGVDYAVSRGLFNGVSDTQFSPDGSTTRAMLVTVLWRYAGKPGEGSNVFSDVDAGSWFEDAIAWANANGVVNGVGGGKFNPNGSITREQMATILYRYSTAQGMDTSARVSLNAFPDHGAVSGYAYEAMQWAVAEGLINGSDGKLLPGGNATRAQVATILMRYITNIAE